MISAEKYKIKLEEEKKSLEEEIKKLETPPDFGDFPGEDDETDESEESYNQLSAAASLKDKLTEIDDALLRIGEGKYGLCQSCGAEIGEDILETIPESRLCQDCKMKENKS